MDLDLALRVARVGIGCALVWSTARRLSGAVSRRDDAEQRALLAGLLSFAIVAAIVAALGAVGQLGPNRMLLAAAVVCAGTLVLAPRPEAPAARADRARDPALLWPVLAALPIVLYDFGFRLPAPATDWDALTYHLYLPTRWLEAGRLLHVPTVFGDPAAAFAPQNGALLFTWWIALLGGDALTNVVNVLPAAILALALGGLGMRCGLSKENAAFSGLALFWVGPVRSAIFEARVDVPMLAFWAASLLFVVRTLDRRQPVPWLAAGLATGLAVGTKVIAVALVGPQAALLVLLLLVRGEARACAGFLVACLFGGAWWFVANSIAFGNPLFPLDLSIAGMRIALGPIPFDAVAGQFHTSASDLITRVLPHFYGLLPLGASLVGGAAVLAGPLWRGEGRPARMLIAAIAGYWALFYFFRLPHNTETRFLLPFVLLALLGWGALLATLERRNAWWMRCTWLASFAALGAEFEALPQWRASLVSPTAAGIPLLPWAVLVAVIGVAAILTWIATSTRARAAAAIVALTALGLAIGLGQQFSVETRRAHYEQARFREWAPGLLAVDHLDPTHERRVAYTGLNLPYALTGPALSRAVRYVNTQGAPDDGFFDFFARDPRLADSQKPGFHRGAGRDDYARWVQNLELTERDWLIVFRLHRRERHIGSDRDGFPIERKWARAHPEQFEPLTSGPTFELYHVLPAQAPREDGS